MAHDGFEKLFDTDTMTKRERVEATLAHRAVDRAAILEQLCYNPRVLSLYTGKNIQGFNYTLEDIYPVIRLTTDLIMPPGSPRGTDRVTNEDGFVTQHDNWASWHVSRPFSDEAGARDWLLKKIERIRSQAFDSESTARGYREYMAHLQKNIGETVILNVGATGFCSAFDSMGLEIFTYFYADYPEVFADYMEVSVSRELERIHAIADSEQSPVILVAEDFAAKNGPIFSPAFLHEHHYPYIAKVTAAWHEHGMKVIYHSDGNWKKVIPDLIATGVDGFYCLEPNCGMDIVELKNTWPEMVWAGGVDGVDLMERGTPEQVRAEVHRHIRETDALQTGGMFVASSSEINPPIKPENYKAMVDAVGELTNPLNG